MTQTLLPLLLLFSLAAVSSSANAMNEKDAYRNLMYFQTAKSESEYCENKLHVQAISQQTKWRNQHAAILSRSISTLEQHFINDKGTSTKDLPAAIAAVWKKLEEVDKRELGNTRTYKTCIKFPESLKFYEAQLVK